MKRSKKIHIRYGKAAKREPGRLASFAEHNPNPVMDVDLAGRIHYMNPAAERLFPDLAKLEKQHPWLVDWKTLGSILHDRANRKFNREITVAGRSYRQSLYLVKETERVRIYGLDITDQRRAQKEREITIEFLRLVNESARARDLIQAATTFFQRESGCQAVGVRLKDGDDFPYFEARGFPQEFIQLENSLCSRDGAGSIRRDKAGKPVFECMCGKVICGQYDPASPFFTEHGSFWTNSTTEMRAATRERSRQMRVLNRCSSQEYESVALIPLHVGEERLGLLQLNDRRQGVFSAEMIGLWERLADQLAVALAKFRAEETLLENRADLSRAQAVGQIGSWRLDVRRSELRWSDETYRIFGVATNTPLTYETFLKQIHPEDRQYVDRMWQAALHGNPYDIEHRILVDGNVRWVREKAELEFDAQGALLGGFGTVQDITETKKKESEHERLNRTLKALRDSSQAVSCASREADFLDAICRIVIEDCGHEMVWIGYADDNERKTVRPVAFAGFEQGYLETLNLTWADTERGRGPTGTAIRRGRPVACRDIFTDPRFRPWRKEALKRGYASSIALPLMDGDHAFGALMIYSKEPDPFTDDEVRLLSELANDLAYGILAIRLRIAHAQAEEYLFKSEERYRSLVELSPDAVFVNRGGRIEYVNPAGLKLFGATSPDQVLGKSPFELFHPDWHEVIRQRIERVQKEHFVPRIEEKIVRLDGQVRDVEVVASHFADQQGTAIQVVLHDITERKQADEQLRLHLTILESTANAVVIAGRDGLIQWVNPAFTGLTGYSSEAVVGKSPRLLKSGMHDRKFYKQLWDTILAGRVWQGELVNKHKNGSHYTEEMTITPVADAQGNITHFIAVKQDVTQRKLMADNLRMAKEAAEAASVAKDHFIANISHELRTPMNAILGMTELALDEELSPTVRNFLATAKESADMLLELLNQILDFSRMQAAQFLVEPAPFSLRRMLAHTMKTLGVRAYEKGLQLICDLPDEVPDQLIGDALRLRQVLTNLIDNAIKFTAQGEIVVTVTEEGRGVRSESRVGSVGQEVFQETERGQENEVLLKFSVEDTGIGIAPQEQERIFAPFTQVDDSMTRNYGGSGLGLAIASNLVNLMGGRIWVESQLGKGSAFSFTVRLEREQKREAEARAQTARENRLQGLPVLVVADNPAIRRLLRQMLCRWGVSPDMMSDVPAALMRLHEAAVSKQAYAVVVVDLSSAPTDAFILANWMKNNPSLVGTMILLSSPCDQDAHVRRCQELGIRCLEKPIFPSPLWSSICQAIGLADLPTPTSPLLLPNQDPLLAARPKRILIVEDNLANQQLTLHVLKKFGHSAEIAANGLEAVERVHKEDFDLVLMDIQMPVMDGFQATAAIRALADPAKARLPIVAMTAHAMRGDRQRCLGTGMDDYLNKPINAAKLFEIIERLATKPDQTSEQKGLSPLPEDKAARIAVDFQESARSDSQPSEMRETISNEVFDLQEALEKCYDRVMFEQMREYFFTQSVEVVEQINQALKRGDAEEVARAAHAVKGTLVYLGAHACLEAAKKMEQMGHAGELEDAVKAMNQFVSEIERLKKALSCIPC